MYYLPNLMKLISFFQAYRKLSLVIRFLSQLLVLLVPWLCRPMVAQDMLLSFARKSSLCCLFTQPFHINSSSPYFINIGISSLILINYDPSLHAFFSYVFGLV